MSNNRKLYLLVNLHGGSVSSSFKIAMAIRRFFDDITVFVPHVAASGGTILALAGNRIRMGMMSRLSPVDVQIVYQGKQISVNSLIDVEDDIIQRISMKSASELSYLEKHLVGSFDPVMMIEVDNIVEMGIKYLDKILTAANYPQEKRKTITEKLVFDLPTHDFVIQADLAYEMGIAVENDYINPKEWKLMRNWLLKYIDEASDMHLVRYVIYPTKGKCSSSAACSTPTFERPTGTIIGYLFQCKAKVKTAGLLVHIRWRLTLCGILLFCVIYHTVLNLYLTIYKLPSIIVLHKIYVKIFAYGMRS